MDTVDSDDPLVEQALEEGRKKKEERDLKKSQIIKKVGLKALKRLSSSLSSISSSDELNLSPSPSPKRVNKRKSSIEVFEQREEKKQEEIKENKISYSKFKDQVSVSNSPKRSHFLQRSKERQPSPRRKRFIAKNSITKNDYSYFYDNSVWEKYEEIVYSIERGKNEKVLLLAKKEGITSDEYQTGDTIMHVTAEYGNEQLFEHFQKLRGDYLIKNYANETPFHLAAREGRINILAYYFNKFQFDIDTETIDGWTASHYSALNGFISCLEFLSKQGANLSHQDLLKRTPLHWACKFNQKEVVQALLRFGINQDLKDFEGKKASDIAKEKGYDELVLMINMQSATIIRRKKPTLNTFSNQNNA